MQQVQCPARLYTTALRQQLFGSNAAAFLDQYRTQQQLAAMVQRLPPAWVTAVQAAQPPPQAQLQPAPLACQP